MQAMFEILRSYPSLGNFLAFQFTIDLNYSELTRFSEMDFVVAGPGAGARAAQGGDIGERVSTVVLLEAVLACEGSLYGQVADDHHADAGSERRAAEPREHTDQPPSL